MNGIDYLQRAIDLSKKGIYPYGAVVVLDGEIIGEAFSGDGEANDPTAHAETLAIRRACKKIGSGNILGATLYSSCEPCFMCFGTIWWANISNIVYATSIEESNGILDTDININIEELNSKTGNKVKIKGGQLAEKALKVMKDWENNNSNN